MRLNGQLEKAQLENVSTDPTNLPEGLVFENTTEVKAKVVLGGSKREIITADQTQTLTNKTVVAASNTITTAASGNLAATELNAALAELQTDIDTRATATALNDHLADTADAHDASAISITAITNVVATDVQGALAEIQADVDTRATSTALNDHLADTTDAHDASAISVSAVTNLTATDVQGAIAELQADVDTRATSTQLSNHEADTTSIHGIADTSLLVTTTGAQVLTAKDIDGGTASNTSRITLPKAAKTTLDALTRKEGTIVYDTTGKKAYIDDGASLVAVGSGAGGGINYIDNPDAETDTSGWATFADGASLVDGTGGAPTATFARSTTSPLRSTASFLFTPGNAGDGASNDFTIADADKAKVLQISFEYQLSGTITEGDYQVYIYDVTNAQLIQPAPYKLSGTSGTNYNFKGTFQSASNSTSYRLILWQSVATSMTCKLDTVSVSPQVVSTGGIATDWVSYTPTGGWTTNVTYSGKWRRVADMMEVQARVTLSGAPDAAVLTISIPSGYTIDATKLASGSVTDDDTRVGFGSTLDSGTARYLLFANVISSTSVRLLVSADGSGGYVNSNSSISHNLPFTYAAGDVVDVRFSVPISGWGTSQVLSSETDTRVVSSRLKAATTSIPNTDTYTIVGFTSSTFDKTGALTTGSSAKFTAQHSGVLEVNGWIQWPSSGISGGITALAVFKNGAIYQELDVRQGALTGFTSMTGTTRVEVVAGDYIDLRVKQNGSGAVSLNNAYLEIERASGPSQIAASESVLARYTTAAGQSIPNTAANTIVDFGTKDYDSHSAVTTGASWKFTAPISGIYEINTANSYASAAWSAGNACYCNVFKGGVAYATVDDPPIWASVTDVVRLQGTTKVRLLAGEYIDFRLAHNRSGGAATLSTTALSNYIEITRVGNY